MNTISTLENRVRKYSNFYHSNGQYTMETFGIKMYLTGSIESENVFCVEIKDNNSFAFGRNHGKTTMSIRSVQDLLINLFLSDPEKLNTFLIMERRMENLNKLIL